jgi:biopolymer transport protein ExbD
MNFSVKKRRAPVIIIVSLVDILIILLIFFVVSTTFKKDQPEVQINLPGELEAAVRGLPEQRKSTLALQADKKASFGTIIKVMDALKLAGVKNLPAFTREEGP